APAEPVVQLVQRAPALGLGCLELARRSRGHVLRGSREVLAETRDRRTLLLALGLQPFGVRADPHLGLGDQLALTLAEAGDLERVGLLSTVEVGCPLGEPLLDTLLRRRERLRQLRCCLLLALRELAAPLLRDAPLLLDEEGGRVGPRTGDCVLDLDSALC